MAYLFRTPPQSPHSNLMSSFEAEPPLLDESTERENIVDEEEALMPFQLYSDVNLSDPAQGQNFDDSSIISAQNGQVHHVEPTSQDSSEQSVLFFDSTFVCPVSGCSRTFSDTRSYRLHRVKFHKLPRFNCIVCLAPFDKYVDLSHHMDKENHLVKCLLCPKLFKRLGNAIFHFNEQHKHFPCMHCTVDIYGRQSYKTHLRSYHVAEENSILAASSLVETAMNSSYVSDGHIEEQGTPSKCFTNPTLSTETGETSSRSLFGFCDEESDSAGSESLMALHAEVPSNAAIAMEPSDNAHTNGSVVRLFIQEDNRSTCNDRLLRNPFASSDNSYPVIFGPGAIEILEETELNNSCPSSVNTDPENGLEWIGHNVDMFHDMSETHRKTYRYVCEKCSHSFTSKAMLQKHRKTHEFICKHCFTKYDSLSKYKNHLKMHISESKAYVCSVCSHSSQGLKNLMVHEMRHRLNKAFKSKLEDAAVNSGSDSDTIECKHCKRGIQGISALLRHEVWHDWSIMWTSYTFGRILKGVFTENDSKRLKKAVEEELISKWRDSSNVKTTSTSKEMQYPLIIDLLDDKSNDCDDGDNNVDVGELTAALRKPDGLMEEAPKSDTRRESNVESEGESVVEDEQDDDEEEDESPVIKGWMSYWHSYLGLDNHAVPSWVMPTLKGLRSQWRTYGADEHEMLYRRMDQIAILIRAQRNETSIFEEPRVVLDRLPSNIKQQNQPSVQMNQTPKEVRVVVEKIPERTVYSLLTHNKSPPEDQELQKARTTHTKNLVQKSKIKSLSLSAPSKRCITRNVGSDTPLTSKASTCATPTNTSPHDEKIYDKTSSVPSEISNKQPVVLLPKLVWPIQGTSNKNKANKNEVTNLQVSDDNLHDNSYFHSVGMKDWVRKEIGNLPIPKWAIPVIKNIWCSKLKGNKMQQIRWLIQAEQNERRNQTTAIKVPFVKLRRL